MGVVGWFCFIGCPWLFLPPSFSTAEAAMCPFIQCNEFQLSCLAFSRQIKMQYWSKDHPHSDNTSVVSQHVTQCVIMMKRVKMSNLMPKSYLILEMFFLML